MRIFIEKFIKDYFSLDTQGRLDRGADIVRIFDELLAECDYDYEIINETLDELIYDAELKEHFEVADFFTNVKNRINKLDYGV